MILISGLRQLIRDIFENPVVLRDIGWKYSRPVLNIMPRHWIHILVALMFVSMFYYGLIYSWQNARGDYDVLAGVILGISSLIGAIMLLLSVISSASAWRRDKDLNHLVDLIMAGMDLKVLAHGKILARGFPVLAITLFLSFHLLLVLFLSNLDYYISFLKNPFNDYHDINEGMLFSFMASSTIMLLLSGVLVYIDGLRVSLTKSWVIFPLIFIVLRWVLLYPLLWIIIPMAFIYSNARLFGDDEDNIFFHYLILYMTFIPPTVYMFYVVTQYRKLLHTIIHHYNSQLDQS